MAAKTGNNYTSELWQIASKFQRQIRDFRWWRARYKISQMIATTIDYQKLQDWRPKSLYCHFRLSVVVAIARGQFLRAGRGPKPPDLPLEFSSCHSSRDISNVWFCRPHCHFRLSVIVTITWRHFIRARHGRKSRLNVDPDHQRQRCSAMTVVFGNVPVDGAYATSWKLPLEFRRYLL